MPLPLTIPSSTSRHPTNLMSSPLLDRQHYFSSPISPRFQLESIDEHLELPQYYQDVQNEISPSLTTQLSNYSLSYSSTNSTTLRPSHSQNLSQVVSSDYNVSKGLLVKKRKIIVKIPTVSFCKQEETDEERESGNDTSFLRYSRYNPNNASTLLSTFEEGQVVAVPEVELAENVSMSILEHEIRLNSLPTTLDIYLPGQNGWKALSEIYGKHLLQRGCQFPNDLNTLYSCQLESSAPSIVTSSQSHLTKVTPIYTISFDTNHRKSTSSSDTSTALSSPSRNSILNEFKPGGILARRLSLATVSDGKNIPSTVRIRSFSLPAEHLDSSFKFINPSPIKLDPTSPSFQFVHQNSQNFSLRSSSSSNLKLDPSESIKDVIARGRTTLERNELAASQSPSNFTSNSSSPSRRTSVGISSSSTYTPPQMEDLTDLAISDSQSSASTEFRDEMSLPTIITSEYENFPLLQVRSQWIVDSILDKIVPLINVSQIQLDLEDRLRQIEDKIDFVLSTSRIRKDQLSNLIPSAVSHIQNLESHYQEDVDTETLPCDKVLEQLKSKVTKLEKELLESRLQNQKLIDQLNLPSNLVHLQ